MILTIAQINEICELLKSRKIGVLPTDTIYGLHCLASDSALLTKIYALKQRPEGTPVITIISSIKQLQPFDVVKDTFVQEQMAKFWPGPNTLILKTLAGPTRSFRMPNNAFLQSCIFTFILFNLRYYLL